MGVRGRISRVVTVMFIDVVVYFEWLCAGRSWWGGRCVYTKEDGTYSTAIILF